VFGTSGSDVLDTGTGGMSVYGGAGADTFVLHAGGVTTVLDFTAGAGGDALDIRDLLVGFNASSSVLSNFVHLAEAGGSTTVQVNADGIGSDFVPIATLQGVTGLLLNDLVANHNVIPA